MFLDKLNNIVEGWHKYHFPSKKVEELALKRATVCAGCPHAEHSTFNEIIEHRAVEMKGMVCNKCVCPITKKVRAKKETCPESKW